MKSFAIAIKKRLLSDNASLLTLLLCALVAVVAVWHALDFSHDFDPEFPGLERDHYSLYAPFAYRLAEPGDTLDLTTLYLSAAGLGLLAMLQMRPETRPAARAEKLARLTMTGICLAGFWIGSAPDPTMDGWHGLAWQAALRVSTPAWQRGAITVVALALVCLVLGSMILLARQWIKKQSYQHRLLFLIAALGFLWRIANWPDPEPWGYWPRWAMIICMIVTLSAILARFQQAGKSVEITAISKKSSRRAAFVSALMAFVLIQAGYYIHWLHWPMARFKVVIPGQLYVSAMPSPHGLKLAHQRHQFKTIINLFNEDTPLRHRDFPAELQFANENGINYIRAQGKNFGNSFIESTFESANDPANWPVLVHCHGNMDRTPAWLGMYRFRYQGWGLGQVFAAIERHRGYRPKGGTTVLYCDLLPRLEPEKWAADPVASRLEDHGRGYCMPRPDDAAAIASQKPESARK